MATLRRPTNTYYPEIGDVLGVSPDITDPVFVVVSASDPELPAGLTAPGGEGTITSVNGDEGPEVTLTAADVEAIPAGGPVESATTLVFDAPDVTWGDTEVTPYSGDAIAVSTGPITVRAIWCGDETAFAAVVTPDENTYYIVVEDEA